MAPPAHVRIAWLRANHAAAHYPQVVHEVELAAAGRRAHCVQPLHGTAEVHIGLGDPLSDTDGEARHDGTGQSRHKSCRLPPRSCGYRDDEQYHEDGDGIGRADECGECYRGGQEDNAQRRRFAPLHGTQEEPYSGQAADGAPVAREQQRGVLLGDPEAAEDDTCKGDHPVGAPATPREHGEEEPDPCHHRQVDAERDHRAGEQRHRRDEQRQAAGPLGAPGHRHMLADLTGVDRLVPEQGNAQRIEQEHRKRERRRDAD